MKKTIKNIMSGAMLLLLGLFFYSGYLYYQDNPHQNPFPEEGIPSAIVDTEIVTDQIEGPRLYGSTNGGRYSFSMKPIRSYAYYRNKVLSNPVHKEAANHVSSAVSVFASDLGTFEKDADKRYDDLNNSIKDFHDNNK